jgi:hypothetical protein
MGIVYNILDGIFEGKRALGRTTSGWDKKYKNVSSLKRM